MDKKSNLKVEKGGGNESGPVNEAPKTRKILIATQQTFRFPWYVGPKAIDCKVNKWLHEKAIAGTPALKGETYVKGLTTYSTYMYSTIAEIPV